MLTVSQLYIYPIKSMGGIAVNTTLVTDRGLQYDRRWILVDMNNNFLTQREFPEMALLQVSIGENHLEVTHGKNNIAKLLVPFTPQSNQIEKVTIWNAVCDAYEVSKEVSDWFSGALNTQCKLMHMPESTMRPVDTTSGYHPAGKFTSFADAYPFLLLSEESVVDLNERLDNKVLINRFRPNIVFSGGKPYCEDDIADFNINGVEFTGLENCGRCGIITINQEDPQKSNEPLKTLSKYRMQNKNIIFGRNTVHNNTGIINIGDELKIK